MSIISLIKEKAPGLGSKVFLKPDIPEKKLLNAVVGITKSAVAADDVLCVLDITVWGKCDDGMVLTSDSFFYKPFMGDIFRIDYVDIAKTEVRVTKDKAGKEKKSLAILGKDGEELFPVTFIEFDADVAADLLGELARVANGGVEKKPAATAKKKSRKADVVADAEASGKQEEKKGRSKSPKKNAGNGAEGPVEEVEAAAAPKVVEPDAEAPIGTETMPSDGEEAQEPDPLPVEKPQPAPTVPSTIRPDKTSEDVIKERVSGITKESVYIVPDIPEKKLNNAIVGMANSEVDPAVVLAVIDTTTFGKSDNGFLFTGEAFYHKPFSGPRISVRFEDVVSAAIRVKREKKEDGSIKEIRSLVVREKNGHEKIIEDGKGMDLEAGASLFNDLAEMGRRNAAVFQASKQLQPLCESEGGVKLAYVKLVCNFCKSDDGVVDDIEYAEIYNLMVRNDFTEAERLEIRAYVIDEAEQEIDDTLIAVLQNETPDGSYQTLVQSLVKDMVYINHRKGYALEDWNKNSYIVEMASRLDVGTKQVEVMVQAIRNDEEILAKRKSDTEITKSVKELASKATAVGLPIAAIYFSGSVVGLSAAGVTSGLASLGMGGILGLSPMVAGIGMVVLVGFGTYKGMKAITGQNELENNKQRELMIQNIIKNHQKAINYLVQDVNYVSGRLVEALSKQNATEREIQKLKQVLTLVSKASQKTSEGLMDGVKEAVLAKLPKELDNQRFLELTKMPTMQKFRPFVYSVYKETKDKDGRTVYRLDDSYSAEMYEKIHQVLKAVKYFEMTAAVSAKFKGLFK